MVFACCVRDDIKYLRMEIIARHKPCKTTPKPEASVGWRRLSFPNRAFGGFETLSAAGDPKRTIGKRVGSFFGQPRAARRGIGCASRASGRRATDADEEVAPSRSMNPAPSSKEVRARTQGLSL
jgi:hypothetical protein